MWHRNWHAVGQGLWLPHPGINTFFSDALPVAFQFGCLAPSAIACCMNLIKLFKFRKPWCSDCSLLGLSLVTIVLSLLRFKTIQLVMQSIIRCHGSNILLLPPPVLHLHSETFQFIHSYNNSFTVSNCNLTVDCDNAMTWWYKFDVAGIFSLISFFSQPAAALYSMGAGAVVRRLQKYRPMFPESD